VANKTLYYTFFNSITMSLVLKRVGKSFGKTQVLKDVSIEVEKGELFSIVGPSGSGKTTLLRIIAGLVKQDEGNVYIEGKLVDEHEPAKRNVGMVFQNYALYPNKSVLENIASPLLVKGVPKSEAFQEAEALAQKLEISNLLDRYPSEISGGQQQRVALARALIKKPALFLLDEPLSNLDAQLRFSARKFVKSVQKEFGITTIYVTHDQSEALSISDRIAVMNRGVVLQVGSPREVYENPKDEFVASFLGSPPLNLIEMQPDGEKTKPITLPFPLPKGKKITVGIRPESIVLGSGPNRARVSAVEYAGRESVVYLDLDGVELRCLSQKEVSVGAEVCFEVVKRGVFLFEENGTSIPWPQ
jgi:ABC-type sugar transport systems, ATPase components